MLLDEIGRGTSTYDGVAIAWAVTEHLHDRVGCKTMFATHYHELMQLPERLQHARNYNVAVRETGDTVVFLHRLEPGGTDRSYGIHVAQLAGLPGRGGAAGARDPGHARGRAPDGARRAADAARDPGQLALFAEPPARPDGRGAAAIDVNALTPLEALNRLAELQAPRRGSAMRAPDHGRRRRDDRGRACAGLACGREDDGTVPHLDHQPAGRAASDADQPPVAINPVSPVDYPVPLLEQGIEGRVLLRLYTDSTGALVPDSTRVAESSGYPALDSAAVSGAAALRFAPALRHGRPVAGAFLQPIHFRNPRTRSAP